METKLTRSVDPKTNEQRFKQAHYTDPVTKEKTSKEFPVFELINLERRIFNNMAKQMGITKKYLRKLIKMDPDVKAIYENMKQEFGLMGEK